MLRFSFAQKSRQTSMPTSKIQNAQRNRYAGIRCRKWHFLKNDPDITSPCITSHLAYECDIRSPIDNIIFVISNKDTQTFYSFCFLFFFHCWPFKKKSHIILDGRIISTNFWKSIFDSNISGISIFIWVLEKSFQSLIPLFLFLHIKKIEEKAIERTFSPLLKINSHSDNDNAVYNHFYIPPNFWKLSKILLQRLVQLSDHLRSRSSSKSFPLLFD